MTATNSNLARHAEGRSNCIVNVDDKRGCLVLYDPGTDVPEVLYENKV